MIALFLVAIILLTLIIIDLEISFCIAKIIVKMTLYFAIALAVIAVIILGF